MSQINPLLGSILQTSQMQKQQSSDKSQQMRHVQDLRKNIAATPKESQDTVEIEQEVESSDELPATRDRQQNAKRPPAKKPKPEESDSDEPPEHLDLTA